MDINWLGAGCFRIRSREATILTDPYSLEGGLPRGTTADIVTVSREKAEGFLPTIALTTRAGDPPPSPGDGPRVLFGPGEYEVRDVLITGIRTFRDAVKGEERGRNTVYLMDTEGMTLCHLGELGHAPTADQMEGIGRVDILLVPVATAGGLTPAKAAEIVALVSPKIVIPMALPDTAEDSMALFLKEMNAAESQPVNRLSLQRANLPEVTTVTLLEARTS